MKIKLVITIMVAMTALLSSNALATNINGKFGVTGRLGFIIPADSDTNNPSGPGRLLVDTDTGFIGGGGLLYGIDEHVALEMDVTHATFDTNSAGWGEADVTNLSFSAQYRFPEQGRVTPYVGGGVDVLISDLPRHTIDTVLGLHLQAGIDYFLTRELALTAELKGIAAFDADVTDYTGKVGNFSPSSLTGTFGVRFFFN